MKGINIDSIARSGAKEIIEAKNEYMKSKDEDKFFTDVYLIIARKVRSATEKVK